MTKENIATQNKNIDTIFMVFSQSDLDTLLPEIKTKIDLNESYSVVALDSLIHMRLAKDGIRYIIPEEHIKESDLEVESREMFDRIHSFLMENHTDVYCVKHQNLFEILRFDIERRIKEIFMYSKIIEHVLQQNKPKAFVLVSDSNTQSILAEYFLSRNNIELIKIHGSFKSKLKIEASDLISKSKTWIKQNIGYIDKSLEEAMKNNTTNKKNALFLIYDVPHLDQLLPVANEINKRSILNAKAIIVNNMNVLDTLVEKNMNYGVFGTYLTEYSVTEIKNRIQSIKNNWGKLEQDEEFKQIFKWDGQDLWDIVRESLREMFLYEFPIWIKTYYTARDMIDAEEPDMIFFTYDIRPHEKSIILAAKGNNVPTLVIQHGVTAGHSGYVPLTADKMAVFGEHSKTFLIDHGIESNRLTITGRPLYDSWERVEVDGGKLRKEFDISSDKKVVSMATGALLYHHVETLENIKLLYTTVTNTINKLEDCKLIIKIHPAEDIDNYKLI
ncbi:MAG: hypothetical protein KAS16_02320, partial [Thermoplasmata archaeon]|nr:hypothetical protein [Thermoplasmata archaeon]